MDLSAISQQLATINSKLDAVLGVQQPTELITRREYLQIRKISEATLWREEKKGLVKTRKIGGKKYYSL